MKRKMLEVSQFWNEQSIGYQPEVHANEIFNFEDYDSLEKFTGSHPLVMKQRVDNQSWKVALDPAIRRFSKKDRFLYWFEKKTGKRLFDFKNYKII